MRNLLDDNASESCRGAMGIVERKVDPRYHTMPFWEQIREFGWAWINEQEKIFDEIRRRADADVF